MKMLMFGMSSYPGGIENYIYNAFVNDKVASMIQIDFVTYEENLAYEKELREKNYQIIHVPHLKKNPIGYYKTVSKIMRNHQYNCVYVNMLTAANVIPVLLADRNKVKSIVLHAHANATVRGWVRKTLHLINKKYCNKKATLKLACSKEAGYWLFRQEKFDVLPNAIDCRKFQFNEKNREEIRNSLKISEQDFVIGHVGRMAEEKNHRFMLEILKEVLKVSSNVKMILVGDGYLSQEIKQKAKELGLSEHIVFYGTSNQTYKLYSAFDCFLFPSTFEGFGMAALEAQACGLKCYCSSQLSPELNVSGTVEYLQLDAGSKVWADTILGEKERELDSESLNRIVFESDYNVEKQIDKLLRMLYENK